MQHWKDMAWRVQDDTEKVLLERAIWLRETTGAKNLCIAGGVALNCVANGKIVREAGFDNVWIQPAAGDDGIAIGCAYYGHLAIQNKPRIFVMNHAFLGAPYSDEEVGGGGEEMAGPRRDLQSARREHLRRNGEAAGRRQRVRLVSGPFRIRPARARQSQHPRRPAQGRDEGSAQQAGQASGRRSGRSRRSCSPNGRSEIFEGEEDSPFMLLAKRVRPEWKDKIPAIVHVDGTARVQTVRREHNERLYRLAQGVREASPASRCC